VPVHHEAMALEQLAGRITDSDLQFGAANFDGEVADGVHNGIGW